MGTLMSLLVKIGADTAGLHTGMNDAKKAVGGLEDAIGGMIGTAAELSIATVAFSALAMVTKEGLDEAMAWEEGLAQLDAGLKSTKGVAGVTKDSILELAAAMQKNTRFSDDAILSASNLALTFTGITKDVFPDVIRLSADMATGMKMDLNSALMQVAKAMQDPIAGATALRRSGVMLTDQQEEMIKTMVAAGDTMSAQKLILGELSTEFEGRAVAAGNTYAGQLDRIGNAMDDVKQRIGDALLGPLKGFADWMISDGVGAFDLLITKLGDTAGALYGTGVNIRLFLNELGRMKDLGLTGEGGTAGKTSGFDFSEDWARRAAGGSNVSPYGPANLPAMPWYMKPIPQSTLNSLQALDTKELADLRQLSLNNLASGTGEGAWQKTGASIGGGAAASMSMPDVLARAFPNMGAAQGWMGAFQGAHGREAGVTDVRDMMAGNAFAARTGRAATDEEWKERYYKGGFEGEDKTGLDAIFGPAGTLSTQMAKKAAADAADYKLMLEAFAAQKTATDTGNTTLVDILEKVTPAGSGDADAAAAGGYAGRGYRDNR